MDLSQKFPHSYFVLTAKKLLYGLIELTKNKCYIVVLNAVSAQHWMKNPRCSGLWAYGDKLG